MKKPVFYWIIAIVITLTAAVYQRMTGPTYPKRLKVEYNNTEYKIKLLRSHVSSSDCSIELKLPSDTFQAEMKYKRFPSNDEWKTMQFSEKDNNLVTNLPKQSAAGKLLYQVNVKDREGNLILESGDVVIRFKGDVPSWVLTPHIFFMFFAMLLSTLAGLLAVGKIESYKLYTNISFVLLLMGGMILGPIVQKYAFGEFWTGVPFGMDLTDNKTLIAFIAWLCAVVANWKKDRPVYTIVAALVLLAVYSIPHSMFGSELDYSTGNIGQG